MGRAFIEPDISGVKDQRVRDALKNILDYLRDTTLMLSPNNTASNTISGSVASADFLTLSHSGALSNERKFAVASPLAEADGGRNGTYTVSAPTVVVGPSSAVSGNLASFNGTTGVLIQDSGLSTTTLTNVVTAAAVIADLSVVKGDGGARGVQGTGVTISSANLVSCPTIQLTSPATSATAIENLLVNAGGAHKVVRLANVRPVKGTFEGQIDAVYKPSAATNWTSRLEGHQATIGIGAASTPAYALLVDFDEIDPSPDYVSFTAFHNTALRFFGGQDGGNMGTGVPGIGFYCDGSDNGTPAANTSVINFEKISNDASGTGDFVYFSHNNTWGADSHWVMLLDKGNGSQQDLIGGFTQIGRWDRHSEKCGQYLDPNDRWQKVDGLEGGGFGFIDAGTTEPID